MKPRKLRNRLAAASSLGAAALAVVLLGVAAPASATITIPPYPATATSSTVIAPGVTQQFGTYPNWLPANQSVSNVIHTEGSDTTLFMMESISDLYSRAGIQPFSCNLVKTAGTSCAAANGTDTQTDLFDNFASTEIDTGLNFVGSSNGLAQLCGGTYGSSSAQEPPGPLGVDIARSSKPPGVGNTCGAGVTGGVGYAKDAVIPVDFQTINPEAYMSTGDEAPGYVGQNFTSFCQNTGTTQPGCTSVGATITKAFPSTGIGNVADGWLPGDPFTCSPSTTPCSGTPFTNLTNTPDPGGSSNAFTSVAYRLFCQHGTSSSPYASQIMDWGNLTNLSAAANGTASPVPVGDGAAIGVPIRVIDVNPGSGTTSTFYSFAESGYSAGTNCDGSPPEGSGNNLDANGASGPNPQTNQGPSGTEGANPEVAVENDLNQVGDFASGDWAGPTDADAADQAIDIATSLDFESLGVYNTNTNAQVASIQVAPTATSGLIPSGQPGTFLGGQMKANGTKALVGSETTNAYAMDRTLFNAYRTDEVRSSVGGFLNWMCDGNSAFQKGRDVIDGGNLDTDLTNLISGQYGFQRLTDNTPELAVTAQKVTGDGIAGNTNGSCAANLGVSSTGGVGTNTITLSAVAPGPIQTGWPVSLPAGSTVATPANTVVLNVSGATITLGTTTGAPSTTVASGSGGGTLANIASWSSPSIGDLAVADASSFPSSGVAEVATSGGNAFVAYTGTDSTDLTGVTFLSQANTGSSTTVSTGAAVTLVQASDLTSGTGASAPGTVYFPGHPPILSVTSPNT